MMRRRQSHDKAMLSSSTSSNENEPIYHRNIYRDVLPNESSSSSSELSSSTEKPKNVGISYWQIYQWPDVFIVGWQPSPNSESSISSGGYSQDYFAVGFSVSNANGCYLKTGSFENNKPILTNGLYYLKYGGQSYPRWFLQHVETLAIHYWSQITEEITNNGAAYTAQVGLGDGGIIVEGCPSSSSLSSPSFESIESVSSISSRSSLSSRSSFDLSSSSSSFFKYLPTNLPSYVSTCQGLNSLINPVAGKNSGMVIEGCFDESLYPEEIVAKGGLIKTVANMGRIYCPDASKLFSIRYGMVSITLRFPSNIINGVYSPLLNKQNYANPDMIIFSVNAGDCYISQPGLYAALTPFGIEFTIWSFGKKTTIIDTTTNISKDQDVVFTFVWDYSRRMLINHERTSAAILINDSPTAWSDEIIFPGDLGKLFKVNEATETTEPAVLDSSAEEIWAAAPFYLGDSPSGKNGLINVVIRRIEIYKAAYGLPQETEPGWGYINSWGGDTIGETSLGFSVVGTRWLDIQIKEPSFYPVVEAEAHLLAVSSNPLVNNFGKDLGAIENNQYPPIPDNLPIGIEEVRGRQ